jgi:hypothetical protein
MKKLLLLMLSLLAGGVLAAQENGKPATTNSVFALHIGPSNPMSDFRSKKFLDVEAGFANPGYSINMSYAYRHESDFGVGAEVFFNRYRIDEEKIKEVSSLMEIDHWQFFGITAGPTLSLDLSNGISSRIRVMGGVAYCNSPKSYEDGELVMNEGWDWSTIVKSGLDFNFNTGKQFCILLGVDYLYTRPSFLLKPVEGTKKIRIHQRISAVNVTAGFGIRF